MAFVFIFRENWKKNLSICNETPKICDLLVLFCLNVLCNYYVIFFWRDRISSNPCAIFILFWWVKNECLWHSVKTPNRDIEVCRICEPLKTFLKKRLGIYRSQNLNYSACYFIQWYMLSEITCGTIFNFRKLHFFQKSFCPADLLMKGANAPAYLTSINR